MKSNLIRNGIKLLEQLDLNVKRISLSTYICRFIIAEAFPYEKEDKPEN